MKKLLPVPVLVLAFLAVLATLPAQLAAQQDTRAQYEASMKEWQETYVEVIKVWNEFNICQEHEAEALEQKYLELKTKGDALADRTIMLATECVQESVTADPELLQLLEPMVLKYYDRCMYQQSAKVGRALRKHQVDDFSLMFHTLRSAFFCNQFDYSREIFDEYLAREDWLERGKLSPVVQPLYDTLGPLEKMYSAELEKRQAEEESGHLPRIGFDTEEGLIIVELFEDQYPEIINQLMVLVEMEENPFFEDISIFYYLKHQFAITGSKTDDGAQLLLLGELTQEMVDTNRGNFHGSFGLEIQPAEGNKFSVSTACRFVQIPSPELNATTLAAGRIVEGMDVFAKLQATHELDDNNELKTMEAIIPSRVKRVFVVRKAEGKVYKTNQLEDQE